MKKSTHILSASDLNLASSHVDAFRAGSVKGKLSDLESRFVGCGMVGTDRLLASERLTGELLGSALILKDAAAQINEIVHALGILRSLPLILQDGEVVESLSLGAGNTGKRFDLETNIRVAEFKFTEWKGADAVRQDSLFKDFYELAEFPTHKAKFMYLIGMDYALKFLRGGRACKSVMSRHKRTWQNFTEAYAQPHWKVSDYFGHRGSTVTIVDMSSLIPEMADR